MAIRKKKISELPVSETLSGVRVLGLNQQGENVQVGLGVVDVSLPILAHSDCTLEERVAHLEQLLVEVISGKTYIPALKVKDFEAWGQNLGVLRGAGAPARVPDVAGQFYVDTTNRVLYFATSNRAVADWKQA